MLRYGRYDPPPHHGYHGNVSPTVNSRVLIFLTIIFNTVIQGGWSLPSVTQELGPVWLRVAEESHPGTVVGDVLAQVNLSHLLHGDVDGQLQLTLISVQPRAAEGCFTVDSLTGMLSVTAKVDRETVCRVASPKCSVKLDGAVRTGDKLLYLIRIYVEIDDVNDHAPNFPTHRINVEVQEDSPLGTVLSPPLASDLDIGPNGISHYELQGGAGLFELQQHVSHDSPPEPKLVLKRRLNREEGGVHHKLRLLAYDGGGDRQQSSALIIDVRVIDVNDNAPRFANNSYHFTVPENRPVGSKIGQIKATDPDEGQNSIVFYGLSPRSTVDLGDLFIVDNSTGGIFLNAPLDYEKEASYVIYVIAYDSGDVSLTSEVPVTLTVSDSNDNAPQVLITHMSLLEFGLVLERAPAGTVVSYVAVSDADSGRNGHVTCHIDDKQHFALHRTPTGDYKLATIEQLDYEETPMHRFHLTCRDHGVPSLITRQDVVVRVEDGNDYAPIFDQRVYTVTVNESIDVNSELLRVHASDNDTGSSGRLTYIIEPTFGETFHINSETGMIQVKARLDFETSSQLQCLVMAVDNGEPQFTSTATVVLKLLNTDDERPIIIDKHRYHFKVVENSPSGTPLGSVTAIDRDATPFNSFTYVFAANSLHTDLFSIDPKSGLISTRSMLDRERLPAQLSLTVTALPSTTVTTNENHHDRESLLLLSDVAIVTIEVVDTNDNRPVFILPKLNNSTIAISPQLSTGDVVTRISVTDADAGNNALVSFFITSYATLSSASSASAADLFYVDCDSALSGWLRIKRPLTTADGKLFSVVLIAIDNGVPRLNSSISIIVEVSDALSVTLGNVSTTILMGVMFVSVPLLLVSVVILLVCCLRKRSPEPVQTAVVKATTNGKAGNGHVTSPPANGAASATGQLTLTENPYSLTNRKQHICDKDNIQLTKLHEKRSQIVHNSLELKRKSGTNGTSNNVKTLPSKNNGNCHQSSSVAAAAASTVIHTSNGTLPSSHDGLKQQQQQQHHFGLSNGSLKQARTSSLGAINGNYGNSNGTAHFATVSQLYTPPLKPANGRTPALRSSNHMTPPLRPANHMTPSQLSANGAQTSKRTCSVAIMHRHNTGSSDSVASSKSNPPPAYVRRNDVISNVVIHTSPRHQQQQYTNNVVVTSSTLGRCDKRHPLSLSSDEDAYETVETPV